MVKGTTKDNPSRVHEPSQLRMIRSIMLVGQSSLRNTPEGIMIRKLLEANEDITFRKLEPSEHMSFRSIGAVGTCAVKRLLFRA